MRPIRTRICHINVAKWFPANDPIATSVARLCVLREDLYLEIKGMDDEPIPTLDECSADWRGIYFFRNSIRTLLEVRSAIETLKLNKPFVRALSRQPPSLNKALVNLSHLLNDVHSLIKKLRNEVAGHLPYEALDEALQRIAPDTECLLQMGNKAKEIHYKFALEFVGATMLRHVDFVEAEKEWHKILKATLRTGFKAIKSIDMLFVAYSRIRNLSI
jgi:hypothetical protein